MSYMALARKWRPRTFSQLVGQGHINKALINALNQQRLHHAYLFTGTRGVGKTSIARILAKSLNCERGISSEPCLECSACISIEQSSFMDLIEIDGASKTGVEDIRDLLSNVQYAPASARFKIYIIDEVHMLSQHSFNALLKTLEEPPAHVKFILATTDPQKLPVTVLSRCLQFSLRHLSPELINQHLQLILKEEGVNFESQAIDILAQAARGSMRDALSLLDQAITSCDPLLQEHHVKILLGHTQQDYALQLLQALAVQNAPEFLNISQKIAIEGGQFQHVLNELLNYFHQIAIVQRIGDSNPLISPSTEIKALAQQFLAEDIQLFYQIALKSSEEIHLAPTLAIGFNMTMLRMLLFKPAQNIHTPPIKQSNELVQQIGSIDSKIDDKELITHPSDSIPEKPFDVSSKIQKENKKQDWPSIVSHLKLTGLALNALENAEFVSKEGRHVVLGVTPGHSALFTPSIITRIEEALGHYYQSNIKISLNTEFTIQASPAQQKEETTQKKQQQIENALYSDPMFQQLQQEFSAELVKNSIVPLKDGL
jgi:DNA polymerase-3 subunit gamma/tau